jgi:homoserine kinase
MNGSVCVRVPGSTSNLGSGFDTLGLALRLYSEVRLARRLGTVIRVKTSGPEAARVNAEQMVSEAASLFFRHMKRAAMGFEVTLGGDLPIGRGLGASGAARVAVLAGLNQLARAGLSRQQLLQLATQLEGHPDNASPALLGGFTVSALVEGTVRCVRFPVSPRVRFVTLIPWFEIDTKAARRLVPDRFTKADTLHGLNRAAFIAAVFASRNYPQLAGLFDDRIHQPYRERLIPQLARVIRAGEKAGAIGGWLSGSGSAIMCVTLARSAEIGQAMQRQLPDSEIRILAADNSGLSVSTEGV